MEGDLSRIAPNKALQPTAAVLGILFVIGIITSTSFGHVPLRRLWLSLGG